MQRNPYYEIIAMGDGETMYIDTDFDGFVFLMNSTQFDSYCYGNAPNAVGVHTGMSKSLTPKCGGQWYFVSDFPVVGTYRIRRGLNERHGEFAMRQRKK